jgi:hypothetical protein
VDLDVEVSQVIIVWNGANSRNSIVVQVRKAISDVFTRVSVRFGHKTLRLLDDSLRQSHGNE